MLGRQQRLGDLLTGAGHDRDGRRANARRLTAAVALAALTALLAGCGGASGSGQSTVAKAVAPPALPDTTTTDGVPASHAVEPPAGGSADGPAVDPSGADDDTSATTGTSQPASAPRASSGGILSTADRASFARLAASLGGEEGLAVSALGIDRRVERVGSLRSAVAWSTSKVPVAMAVIAAGGEASQQANLRQAITASDNAAAERLWASLGSGQSAASAADRQLRAAGDKHTSVEYHSLRGAAYTPFGQTSWALTDQARFSAGLACSDPGRQVLALMNQVVGGQRWGLGSAGVDAQLKGGWGPGSTPGASGGYLDRQMGVLTIHGKPVAVSIATRPADGSHESGTRNLTAIARWLVAHADTSRLSATPNC
jgi:hypothetical protein